MFANGVQKPTCTGWLCAATRVNASRPSRPSVPNVRAFMTTGNASGLRRATEHLRGEVPLARPRGQIGQRQMEREVVHLAVEFLRREAERVLVMELVGDLR